MLSFLPPYEFKTGPVGYSRGTIHHSIYGSATSQDFVITGPKMKIVYGGCKWNRLCLAMTSETPVKEFASWLECLESQMETTIMLNPQRYKLHGNASIGIDKVIRVSNEPSFSDLLRSRLSVQYVDGPSGDQSPVINADLFYRDTGGKVDPSELKSGWSIVPIFRISYQKQGNVFGLVLTVLKGEVWKQEQASIANSEWILDVPMEV